MRGPATRGRGRRTVHDVCGCWSCRRRRKVKKRCDGRGGTKSKKLHPLNNVAHGVSPKSTELYYVFRTDRPKCCGTGTTWCTYHSVQHNRTILWRERHGRVISLSVVKMRRLIVGVVMCELTRRLTNNIIDECITYETNVLHCT